MQELNGYIKLFRKLIRWGWYQDNVVKGLFIHCLLCASYKDFEWMGMELKAGQFITSLKHLSEELGFSIQQIRTAIKKLEGTGEITSTSTNKNTIITVVNWENFQSFEDESNTESNNPITNEQQTKNAVFCKQIMNNEKNLENSTSKSTNKISLETPINKELFEIIGSSPTKSATNEQQTNNKRATNEQQHRKNIKNIKNIKKRENNAHAHARELPSEESIISFCSSVHIPEAVGKKFFDYYSPRNWMTTRGSDVAGCWKEKLIEWNKKEIPCRKAEEKGLHASYDRNLVDKLMNSDD